MSIIGAMYSGISGLGSNATMMEIIGNNLANINTPAFKFSRADFSDVLAKTLAGGMEIGRGSRVGDTSMVMAQGGFQSTENVTDIALSGKGFFMVRDDATNSMLYTRNGSFMVDKNGYVTNSAGMKLMGFSLNENSTASGVPHDIRVTQAPLAPKVTTEVSLYANLDSQAEIVGPFDITNPVNTSNFTASITVYDTLGNPHQVTSYFSRNAAPGAGGGNVWEYNIVVDAADSATGADYVATSGTIEFSTEGALLDQVITQPPDFDFAGNPLQNQDISFEFGTPISAGGTGTDGTTQFGEGSALVFASQDGYGTSYIDSLNIDSDGKVIALYGNGETREIAQIAIVNFSNAIGLDHRGNNMFGSTSESGEPIISIANVSGNGSIFSNTLELSNVDIAQQFVEMITTQRGFQANSKSITTADTMIAELINISR
ncbi:MAG: flagellar hook protein FlgE [Myxococcales bacterium]|nr:flagellar hook protein FlgE [Myxococcales bacterium]